MRTLPAAAAALALVLAPALAAAQPGLAPGAEPVPAVPAYAVPPPPAAAADAAPPLVGIEKRQVEDVGADRAYLARSALIAPSGAVTFQLRAPIAPVALGQVSASFGRFELGVGGIGIAEEGRVLAVNGKVQLLRSRRAALAASLDIFAPPDDDETLFVPSLVASLCADGDACNTLVSLHLTALAIAGEDEAPVFGGVSWSMGRGTKLVGELHVTDDEHDSVVAGYVGGRWGLGKLALDAGVGFGGQLGGAQSCSGCYDDGPEIMPWPFVGLSGRL